MNMANSKFFPVSSFIHFYIYHPYGNTPPEDLLQSVSRAVKQPNVLLLGCGDLRSCFFTLWNNFYHKNSRHFKGVHFVLNDSSAAVLARNIIFLYLCTQMPTDHSDRVKWVASFWSIWYCHELLPHHKEVLVNAISKLLKWSESAEVWSENFDNPLRSLVKFATSATLSEIHQVWKMWYNNTTTVEDMRSSRANYFQQLPTENLQDPMRHLFEFFGGILYQNLTVKERKKIKEDLEYYYKNGFAFAEEVFGLPLDELKSANDTFIVRSDGVYNLPCTFTPYRSYFFTFQFSPKNLGNYDINFPLMVSDEHFTNHPLLANSVQLFSVWVRSCAEILSQHQHNVHFTFQCSDALEFCQQLHNKSYVNLPEQFDAIYSSNLLDYLAPLGLVLLTMPILERNGSLFTTALYYSTESNTSTEYLKKHFGFDCKYLPLLCGVRCLGYENEYSDTVSVKPVPFMFDIDTALCTATRSFVWRHATVMPAPLKQVTENHFSSMWSVLNASIVHLLTYSSSNHEHCDHYYNCTGTVMILLQSFASQLDKEYDCSSYRFWSPLCKLLMEQKPLQCYITSLQTQALLHGVHLHLTVLETNCPLCNNQPLSETINQYSFITQDLTSSIKSGGKFTVLVYNRSNVNIYNWKHSDFNSEVHAIDTFDGNMTNEKLRVTFFAPVRFFQENYCISLVFRDNFLLDSGEIRSCDVPNTYLFNQMKLSHFQSSMVSSLGTVFQHSGNDSSFETVIFLRDQTMSALQDYQLATEQHSDSSVRIKVNNISTDIFYPYSISYSNLIIRLSRKNQKITVFANRKSHYIYDEEPVYIVNPENILSFPVMPITQTDATYYCELQDNRPRILLESSILNLKHGIDEYELKQTFFYLFKETNKSSFCLFYKYEGYPGIKYYCLVTVINRLFDMQNKVPALDILYCNSTSNIDEHLFSAFNPNKEPYDSIHLNKAEKELCTKMLNYFTRCTIATSPPVTNAIYKSLAKKKVEHHFRRAVIYPLFSNLDENAFNSMGLLAIKMSLSAKDPLPNTTGLPYWFHFFMASLKQHECSYCRCSSEALKKCSKCHLVQYCNITCQRMHWKTHKPFCNTPKRIGSS